MWEENLSYKGPRYEVMQDLRNAGEKFKMTIGYCVKCKEKREMKDEVIGKTSRGVNMVRGVCPICNTKMCKIGGKQ